MDVPLHDWLEDIDLEEYEESFRDLGVKKVKYLNQITMKHLTDMNMAELEVERFMEKRNKMQAQEDESKHKDVKKVQVEAPGSLMGPKITVNEDILIRRYEELWYPNPVNYKERVSNSFILGVCSSAHALSFYWQTGSV